MELQFDKYRRDLEGTDFTPVLRITYMIHVGRGYRLLGNSQAGIPYLERAIQVASQHHMNQLLFEAEAELANAKRGRPREEILVTPSPTENLQHVIDAIQDMKGMAGIT
jgi:hypothetical protein